MNVPNLLTIVRFFLIPIYIYVFYSQDLHTAFAIVVLAGLTDILDGYIARKYNLITKVGQMLDPLADKSMMITVILTLTSEGIIPLPAAFIIFGRDILMILSATFFHFNGKQNVQANGFGKVTTVLFYVALLMLFFQMNYAVTFLYGVIAFSIVTTVVYALEFRLLNGKFFK
jgi:cardiolipin synthase